MGYRFMVHGRARDVIFGALRAKTEKGEMDMKHMMWKTGLVAGMLCVGLALGGCAPGGGAEASDQGVDSGSSAAPSQERGGSVVLHRGYAVTHGDQCFTQVVVATAEDGTILGVNLDDYQFMASSTEGLTGVPNSDDKFGEGIIADTVLISKAQNNAVYSANMEQKASSTQEWLTSIKAIEDYAVGKKAADLEDVSGLDAVSGATLVDTANYLKAIAETAENDDLVAEGTYTGDGSDLSMGSSLSAVHGQSAFCSVVALVQGDDIVAASIDEFQFMSKDTAGIEPVPNSDAAFGEKYADGVVLASKAVNSKVYSENLKAKGNATQDWDTSIEAIEEFVAGKTPDELGSVSSPDAVSGATLTDTAGYVKAVVQAAEEA